MIGQAIQASNQANGFKTSATLPLVTDQSGYNISVNKRALPSSDVEFILIVKEELMAKGFSITSYTLPASSRELDVGLAGQQYIVKFNLASTDAQQQSGT